MRRPTFLPRDLRVWCCYFEWYSESGEWVPDVVYVEARTAGGAVRKAYVEIQHGHGATCSWRVTALELEGFP